MRILLLGAYGFIGSAIARELIARGHEVTGLGRDCTYGQRILPQLQWVAANLAHLTLAENWKPLLEGHEAVVNASGLLQGGDGGSVEAVQLHAIRALMEACEAAGVQRLIQISAAGAHSGASTDFMRTKAAADAAVRASNLSSLILRPGLVVGRNSYGGTELVRIAAAVPILIKFPFLTKIQTIALADVVEAVAANVAVHGGRTGCFDLVEGKPHSLNDIVAAHRAWLGLPEPQWTMRFSGWQLKAISAGADLLGRAGWRSPLRSNAIDALQAGVLGDADQTRDLLGRDPQPLQAVTLTQPAGKQDRLHARLGMVQPLIIASLFAMWAASGAATLFQLDRATAILEAGGLDRGIAYAVAIGGGWLDVMLAIALVWRRTVRPALLAMIALTIFVYLAGGTVLLPGLWIDPLAPLAKALPATMLALVAYWLVEKR